MISQNYRIEHITYLKNYVSQKLPIFKATFQRLLGKRVGRVCACVCQRLPACEPVARAGGRRRLRPGCGALAEDRPGAYWPGGAKE